MDARELDALPAGSLVRSDEAIFRKLRTPHGEYTFSELTHAVGPYEYAGCSGKNIVDWADEEPVVFYIPKQPTTYKVVKYVMGYGRSVSEEVIETFPTKAEAQNYVARIDPAARRNLHVYSSSLRSQQEFRSTAWDTPSASRSPTTGDDSYQIHGLSTPTPEVEDLLDAINDRIKDFKEPR